MKKTYEEEKNPTKSKEYHKYRWFYTSNNLLVFGGKNALQNEELMHKYIKENPKFVVMHTKEPGSPFSFINSLNYSKSDLLQTSIFTACFSRAWRENKKKASIDIFLSEQIVKSKNMKTGTFGVVGTIDRKVAPLILHSTFQDDKIRFVPQKEKNSITITPGKISKEKTAEILSIKLNVSKEDVLNALPTGSFKIIKN